MSTFVKKATSAIAGLAIVFSMVTPIAGVSAALSGVESANQLATLGVIVDQSANPAEYRLGDNLPRKEAVKVMMNLSSVAVVDNCTGVFSDLTSADWACKYAETALDNGLVAANATFRPDDLVSKIEALKMVFQGRGLERDENADWRAGYVSAAVDMGIATSFSDYDTPATRAEMFIWAAEAINMEDEVATEDPLCELLGICEEDPVEPTEPTEPTTPTTGGTATVSLSPLSPNAGVVAAGKDRTPFVAFDVTAGASDVTLKDVMLTYIGLSDSSSFDNLAVYRGNNKVTKQTGRGFDNDEEADLSFENDTVVEAGETVTFMVSGLVSDATTNVAHQIEVSEVTASATVTLGNVRSVVFNTVSAENTATLDIDANEVTTTLTIGEVDSLGEFTLEEELDNEDVIVKSITIKFGGGVDAEDDIADLVLMADGEVVASNLMINSDDEIIVDLEYVVMADESVDFELEGVLTGSIGDTLTVELTEVYAVGADTGVIASLDGDALPVSIGNFGPVDGAEVNVSFDKSDIDEAKPGAEDVLVGTLTLMSATDYTIDSLSVTAVATGTGVSSIVADLELDGASFDNESAGVYTFEDISLDAGVELELDLVLEVEDDVLLNGTSIDFTVAIVEVTDEENDETFNALSSPDLDSVLSSNSFDSKSIDIETASYNLTQSRVSQRNLVLGNGIEVVLYQGKLNVGDADSVLFRDFTFNGTNSSTGSYDFEDIIDSVTLNIGGVTDDGDVNPTNVEFNSSNIEVAAGANNVEVRLTAVLKDNDSVNNGDEIFFTLATADVVAEDSDGEDLVSGAGNVVAASSNTVVQLNERGTFSIAVVNDGENEDSIEDVVLAGTMNVAIAEVVLEAEEEDMDVNELRFTIPGAFDNTIENARLMNGGSTIADGATITLVGGNTVIEFEDFTVSDTGEEIDATLVVDLNIVTTEGGVVSATAGSLVVNALVAADMDVEGASSNDDITADLSANVASDAVAVVPVLMTVATVQELGVDEDEAIISFNLDFGNNELDNDDVVVTQIALENDVSGVVVRNDDNATVTLTDGTVTPLVFTANNEINNGDEFSLRVATEGDELRININGVTFTVDGQTYTSLNDKVIDLDIFTDSTN